MLGILFQFNQKKRRAVLQLNKAPLLSLLLTVLQQECVKRTFFFLLLLLNRFIIVWDFASNSNVLVTDFDLALLLATIASMVRHFPFDYIYNNIVWMSACVFFQNDALLSVTLKSLPSGATQQRLLNGCVASIPLEPNPLKNQF